MFFYYTLVGLLLTCWAHYNIFFPEWAVGKSTAMMRNKSQFDAVFSDENGREGALCFQIMILRQLDLLVRLSEFKQNNTPGYFTTAVLLLTLV